MGKTRLRAADIVSGQPFLDGAPSNGDGLPLHWPIGDTSLRWVDDTRSERAPWMRLRCSSVAAISLATVLAGCAPVHHGALRTGAHGVEGRVLALGSQAPLGGVTIAEASTQKSTLTDAAGRFGLELSPGVHQITVWQSGYETLEKIVEIPVDKPLGLEIELAAGRDDSSKLGDAIVPPILLDDPLPVLTNGPLLAYGEGSVVVSCKITIQGAVRDCETLSGAPARAAAFQQSLLRRRYRPALRHGEQVEVNFTFRFNFGVQ
jgi:hypothetical protein